jgi:hypothetical protein
VRAAVEVIEEPLTAAQQDRHDRQVQVVDQAGVEVLLDGGGTAADPDVGSSGRLRGSSERRLDAVLDEVERGAADPA